VLTRVRKVRSIANSPLALNVWFTTNAMWLKNNAHVYVARTSNKGGCNSSYLGVYAFRLETQWAQSSN